MGGLNLPGFGDIGGTALGFGMEAFYRNRTDNLLKPYREALDDAPTPEERAHTFKRGTLAPNMFEGAEEILRGAPGLTPSFDSAGDPSGEKKRKYVYNTYGLPEEQTDAIWQEAVDRYKGEKAIRDRAIESRDFAKEQFDAGLQDFDTQDDDMVDTYNKDTADWKSIAQATAADLRGQIDSYKASMNQALDEMRLMRGDALASAQNNAAKNMEDMTTGIQAQIQAQEAEIDADPNLTAGQKSAAKGRMRFVNGSELRSTAAKMLSEESARLDGVRAEHDGQISNALAQMTGAEAGLRGNVSMALTELSTGYIKAAETYRSTIQTTRANMAATKAAFRMTGAADLYNMTNAIPEVYFDHSAVMGDILGLSLDLDQTEFARNMDLHNAAMAREGLTAQTSQWAPQAGWGADLSQRNTQSEIEATAANRPGVLEGAATGFASGFGQGAGKAAGGALFGGGTL